MEDKTITLTEAQLASLKRTEWLKAASSVAVTLASLYAMSQSIPKIMTVYNTITTSSEDRIDNLVTSMNLSTWTLAGVAFLVTIVFVVLYFHKQAKSKKTEELREKNADRRAEERDARLIAAIQGKKD